MKRSLIIVGYLMFLCGLASSTQVSGDVWGEWTIENSPYEVVGDLHVPQCSTLIIRPGCYIDFQGYYKLEVDTFAVLQAIGNQTDSVLFTTNDTLTCWEGIDFLNDCGGSELIFCIIEWTQEPENPFDPGDDHDIIGGAIYLNNSDISIANCMIRSNKVFFEYDYGEGGGIYCLNSILNLEYCTIMNNNAELSIASGIYAEDSEVMISNCIIKDNRASFSGSGLLSKNSYITLECNLIEGNITYYGLGGERSGAVYIDMGEAVIHDNKIVDNYSGHSGGGLSFSGLQ